MFAKNGMRRYFDLEHNKHILNLTEPNVSLIKSYFIQKTFWITSIFKKFV